MSAFLVSDNHIDTLVCIAIFGVAEKTAASGHWHGPYFSNPPRKVDVYSANQLGEMLVRENEASVRARYPRANSTPAPAYRFPFNRLPMPYVSAVAALKLVVCYEYQSCEHEGWDSSLAKKFCASLKSSLISSLPGYDAAPWTI